MARFLALSVICTAALALAGCHATYTPGKGYGAPAFARSGKTLMAYNYDAVDALVSRAGKAITKSTPLVVGTIGNVNNVESSSTLGRTISEQLSARLAQKGYKIAELKLRQGISIQQGGLDSSYTGEYLLSRDVQSIAGEHKAAAAVAGTYSVGANSVLVNLRLIDIRSGNIITAYDYVLPKTADVAVMTGNTAPGGVGIFSHHTDYSY